MSNDLYVDLSLELHLFFDRIMKEHAIFLQAGFLEKDRDLKSISSNFQKIFSDILLRSINLADRNIQKNFISSSEMVTDMTKSAEEKTTNLSGIFIDTGITEKELSLQSGNRNITPTLLNNISNLNRDTLPIIKNFISFKNDILNKVLSCKMYTTNYPLLITHIMNEAKMYYDLLQKIENKEVLSRNYLYEQEVFWNNIMKEHAEFIRGLLDPSEENLILTADQYAEEYKKIIKSYNSNNFMYLTKFSLNTTVNFRDFKIKGEEGILNCKVKSIILPLLADHVLREANHFIRILRMPSLNY